MPQLSPELTYLALVFALFVVPKFLQRFRLPAAVTSVVIGFGVGFYMPALTEDTTVKLFSTLGIVALFLFAGLEVDFTELREARGVIAWHLGVQLALVALVAWILGATVIDSPRAAALVSLALVTPSTGFILDSISSFGLSPRETFWIKSKAVSTEIVALGVLFFVLQTQSLTQFVLASLALAFVVGLVPLLFRFFAAVILPYAPKSEFAFLVIVALLAAYATRRLGVYYLVGAFIVGVVAQRFQKTLPGLASNTMMRSVEVFASFFVPFYFFGAGLHVHASDLALPALAGAGALLLVMVPLRLLSVAAHRRYALHEPWRGTLRVATPLLPTLVFTLVLAEIVRESFDPPPWLFGALVIYALAGTLIPGLVFGAPTPDPDLADPAHV